MKRMLKGVVALAALCGPLPLSAQQGAVADAPTVASLSQDGPYSVAAYTSAPDAAEYAAATIYYPVGAPGPYGGVAIAPGFTERQRHVDWWGPRLASHGFAVLILDTNEPRDRPDARAAALSAGLNTLRAEGERNGSPLRGRIDPDRMAVMGHSMGGGGALLAADSLGDAIRAAIPFTPWQPDAELDGLTAPTLIIAGESDRVAEVAEHAWPHFETIPDRTLKVYIEFAGGDHFIANTGRGTDLPTIGRYAIAWLKLHLDDDDRYGEFIYGAPARADAAKFSRYVTE